MMNGKAWRLDNKFLVFHCGSPPGCIKRALVSSYIKWSMNCHEQPFCNWPFTNLYTINVSCTMCVCMFVWYNNIGSNDYFLFSLLTEYGVGPLYTIPTPEPTPSPEPPPTTTTVPSTTQLPPAGKTLFASIKTLITLILSPKL